MATEPETTGLDDTERAILDLEARTFRHMGSKERAIREELGMRRLTYFVRLNALIDKPAALQYAPMLVNRLRARRTSAA